MIEELLKKRKNPFSYGEVKEVDIKGQRVKVETGDSITWINTDLTLNVGDTIICGADSSGQKFIVQAAANIRPSVNTLLSL